ncbi:MAG: DNA-formamidopyrimidine glycosylase [Candidatus Portnoybacteria bacterium]|nr:DNA-formamidopyrimidine glycosylase [Candidatus Portnoybacteria bacterium]
MPELPEVETIRGQLDKFLAGKKIKEVRIKLPKLVKFPTPKFKKIIIGQTIQSVSRRAKILVFNLSNGWSMLTHLKLTGRLIFRKADEPLQKEDEKWNHLIYSFSDGSRLFHNDLRQFGYVKMVETSKLDDYFIKEKFGPEPLEKGFNFEKLLAILKKRPKMKIKQFLMDQTLIAGIGNIYSDEVLFYSNIHPLRRAGDLSDKEAKKIFGEIKRILPLALKLRGTSENTYLDARGREGEFATRLKVYGRKGEKCDCGGVVERIRIGGRSAHFCPKCQNNH